MISVFVCFLYVMNVLILPSLSDSQVSDLHFRDIKRHLFRFSVQPLIPCRSGKMWWRHSCINNPLQSSRGFEILTEGLAGTTFCCSSNRSRGKTCLTSIINQIIQQQHSTSRPGMAPRQPDRKIPSLQIALREDLYMYTVYCLHSPGNPVSVSYCI